MSDVMISRAFTMADQRLFARWSGDFNPMHVDPIAARRTEPGAPIVHAMHGVLWAIDALSACDVIDKTPMSVSARFQRFIYPETAVTLNVTDRTAQSVRATLSVDGLVATTLEIGFTAPAAEPAPPSNGERIAVPSEPLVLDMPAMAHMSGCMPSMVADDIADAFPDAARVFASHRIQGFAALSSLVGMVCPGLHSIFNRFDVRLKAAEHERPGELRFEVRKVDERFRIVDLAVSGNGLSGALAAFVRWPPIEQRRLVELAPMVGKDEFASTTALVVGGSRGLGAATAKIIAAGGGRVVITYLVGENEAHAIAGEIGPQSCRVTRFDALDDPALQLSGMDWDINQIYYFASPHVRRQKSRWFERDRFEELLAVQVDAFYPLCAYAHARTKPPLSVFYPSTRALDDAPRGASETRMSKAAGEVLCAEMNREWREMRVVVSRLAPVLTDQTAAVKPAKLLDASDVMLPIVRDMTRTP